MANSIEDLIMDDFTVNPGENIFGVDKVDVNTNLKDEISNMLVASLKAGKLDPKYFQNINDKLKLNINMEFDNDYSLAFSTNDRMGDTPVDYKIGLTKEF